MSAFELYWILRLDSISSFFIGSGVFLLIVPVFCFIIYTMIASNDIFCCCNKEEEDQKKNKNFLKRIAISTLIIGIVFSIISVFVPTTKEAILIYSVPPIVNNERVKELPNQLLDYIDHHLHIDIRDINTKESE